MGKSIPREIWDKLNKTDFVEVSAAKGNFWTDGGYISISFMEINTEMTVDKYFDELSKDAEKAYTITKIDGTTKIGNDEWYLLVIDYNWPPDEGSLTGYDYRYVNIKDEFLRDIRFYTGNVNFALDDMLSLFSPHP